MTTPAQAMAAAEQLRQAGHAARAEALYRRIVEQAPDFDPAWHALGMLAFDAGKLELAVRLVGRAIRLNREQFLYHRNIGELYRRLGYHRQAIAAGRAATRLKPDDAPAHANLGLAYAGAGQPEMARQSYERALELAPGHSEIWNNLGATRDALGDVAGAEQAYARAVACDARNAEAQNNLGAIYSADGRLEQAIACFEAAIAARPDFISAHHNLSSLKTYASDDPHLATLESMAHALPQVPDSETIRFYFALGKAREDSGDYARAFSAYAEGNRRQHALLVHRPAQFAGLIEHITRLFDNAFIAARQRARPDARRPVFVLGMPRSGTTLIEQILSSHPQVFGAGELATLPDIIVHAPGAAAGRPFTEALAELGADGIQALATAYLDRAWQLAPASPWISDKMPANFLHVGMIYLMFPQARIIHAMRDPMDSCFSCYARRFNETMEFAYDLATLGHYYVAYIELMRHWHAVLPAGTILDVSYEDVVADTEGQARRMLDYLGLPWDPGCLEFFNTRRAVKTASVAQVRQPIYTSSVARWERFGRDKLAPLLALVEPYRDRSNPYGL